MESPNGTFEQHLQKEQERFHAANGEYLTLLVQISLAAKVIARALGRAALENRLGYSGEVNVQGEKVKKMDRWANDVLVEALRSSRSVCTLVSEEMERPLHLSENCDGGKYVVCFDPVDGSSNIDVNGVLGTIFSVRKRQAGGPDHPESDILGKGRDQVSAGYIMYGPSTVLVYSSGRSVDGFTLEPDTGEFILTHRNIRIPKSGKTYSVNEGNYHKWHAAVRRLVDYFREIDRGSGRPYSHRYIGSLVADFHRTLLEGGIFLYPADAENANRSKGKLRLLYEAAPLALIAEAAGGKATTGEENILDLQAASYHQRVPLMIGSLEMVDLAEDFCQGRRR